MDQVALGEFKKELERVRHPNSRSNRLLRIEGYFKPHFDTDTDIPSAMETVRSIEEIFQQGLDGLPLEIKTAVAAIQTELVDASEENGWTRYNSLVYCVKPWALLGYAHLKIAKPFGDSKLDSSLIFLFSLSIAPKYLEVAKNIVTSSWSLIELLQESAKEVGVRPVDYDPASIYLIEGDKYTVQGYGALQRIGLNLERKPLFSFRHNNPV